MRLPESLGEWVATVPVGKTSGALKFAQIIIPSVKSELHIVINDFNGNYFYIKTVVNKYGNSHEK